MKTITFPQRLLMMVAHPDDETYLGVGLLRVNALSGGVNTVLCGTCGEKGTSHLQKPVSKAVLKSIRCREIRSVCKAIPRTKVYIGHHPDGKLAHDKVIFLREARRLANKIQPSLIVSFGRDGITGHFDHVACGAVARTIAKSLKVPMLVFTYPTKYHATMPNWLKGRRKSPHYQHIAAYHQPKLHIKVEPTWKLRMLRKHASQLSHDNPYHPVPKRVAKHFLANEYYG